MTEDKTVKDFLEMMDKAYDRWDNLHGKSGVRNAEAMHKRWLLLWMREQLEYQAMRAKHSPVEDRPISRAYCLEVELDEVVGQILRAKDLDRLKETTRLNFPKHRDVEDSTNNDEGWTDWEGEYQPTDTIGKYIKYIVKCVHDNVKHTHEGDANDLGWYNNTCYRILAYKIVTAEPVGHNLSPTEPTCAKNAQVQESAVKKYFTTEGHPIESGELYELRDGRKVFVHYFEDNEIYGQKEGVEKGGCWSMGGAVCEDSPASGEDIMRPWKDTQEEPEQSEAEQLQYSEEPLFPHEYEKKPTPNFDTYTAVRKAEL